MKKHILSLLALMCLAFPAMAQTEKIQILGTFGDWSAYTISEADGLVCYMSSMPIESQGKYKLRDDVFLTVTHRLGDKTFDVVSVIPGYTYKKTSKPLFSVDKNKAVKLIAVQNAAWASDADDKKLVSQMRKGSRAVLKGTSVRGTLTTDTFSLKGFSKAYQAIQKACGR